MLSMSVTCTMVILCRCSVAGSPVDEGVEAWKWTGCLSHWTGLSRDLRARSSDGSEVFEVVLAVGAVLLVLLLLLMVVDLWLQARAGVLIVSRRLDVGAMELRGRASMFARGVWISRGSIPTRTGGRNVAVALRLFLARSSIDALVVLRCDRRKGDCGGDRWQCPACCLLTSRIVDGDMLQWLKMDVVIVVQGVIAAV
jgi:hypothetical protein